MYKTIIFSSFILVSIFALSQNSVQINNPDILTRYQILSLVLSTISAILILIGFFLTIFSLKRNHDWNRRSKSIDALAPMTDRGRIDDLTILNEAFNYSQSNEPIY